MNNFVFYNPTKIIFGKETIRAVGKEIPKGSKVMITFGGGSIKRNKIYDEVLAALAGFLSCRSGRSGPAEKRQRQGHPDSFQEDDQISYNNKIARKTKQYGN